MWIRNLPPESATARDIDPDVEWGLTEHLLAATVDALSWANYQRSEGKGQKPKPVPRPGVSDNTRRYGNTELSPEEARAILTGYREGAYAQQEVTDVD